MQRELNYVVDIGQRIIEQPLNEPLFTHEQNAHAIRVTLKRYGEEVQLSGAAECEAYILHEETQVSDRVEGSIEGNVVTVVIPPDTYLTPGFVRITLLVTEGEETLAVLRLTGTIKITRSSNIYDPSGQAIPDTDELIRRLQDIEEYVDDVEAFVDDVTAVLAPSFDPEDANGYSVGEFVIYNAKMYRCTVPHTGAWDPSHFEETTAADMLEAFDDEISNLKSQIFYEDNFINFSGYIIKTNGAVTDNGDGSFTFGTSDYGNTIWVTKGEVPAGDYWLFPLPAAGRAVGFSFVNSEASHNTPTPIQTNNTDSPVAFTNPVKQTLYFGIRCSSNPASSFTVSPSFVIQNPKNNNVQNVIPSVLYSKNGNFVKSTDFTYDGTYINPKNGRKTNYEHYKGGYVQIPYAGTFTLLQKAAMFGTNYTFIPLFDSEYNYIKSIQGTSSDEIWVTFTIDDADFAKAKYIAITMDKRNDTRVAMLFAGTYHPSDSTFTDACFTPYNSADVANVLKQKIALFDGDSICAASTDSSNNGAYAGRVASNNDMRFYNYAVGGGTLTSGLYNQSGNARHWVSATVDTMYSEHPDADYIIFEGGTNDADNIGSILNGNMPAGFGSVTANDFSGNYNAETFCGAVETIIYKAMQHWPHAKIGFVIAMKMGTNTNSYNNRRAYFQHVMDICKKWGLPYINLWDECPMNPNLISCYDPGMTAAENAEAGKLYRDGQHPTPAGYDRITPIIEAWMRTL